MKNFFQWFRESHRWQHLVGGIAIGALGNTWYCALLAGTAAAGSLEFKDYQWGGKPDPIDFLLTLSGSVAGHLLLSLVGIW